MPYPLMPEAMTLKIPAGMAPPVTLLVGELSSLPTQTAMMSPPA